MNPALVQRLQSVSASTAGNILVALLVTALGLWALVGRAPDRSNGEPAAGLSCGGH